MGMSNPDQFSVHIQPINSSEEANDHDQQQNATEQEQAENDNNVNETEPNGEPDCTDTRRTTPYSHTTTQQISLLVKIDTTPVDDDEGNDGFRTPTSSEHKIPEIRSCPPAPRKTMLHRRPALRTRRKIMSRSTRRVLLDVSKEGFTKPTPIRTTFLGFDDSTTYPLKFDGFPRRRDTLCGSQSIICKIPKRARKRCSYTSAAFLLVFLAYGAVQNIESTLNTEDDLGTTSLGILYVSFTVCSMFAFPVVRSMGSKRTLGVVGYWLFIAANLEPKWYSMFPASVYLGFTVSIIWVGQEQIQTEDDSEA
ncbi:UNC93-like protein [Drosera capensis]